MRSGAVVAVTALVALLVSSADAPAAWVGWAFTGALVITLSISLLEMWSRVRYQERFPRLLPEAALERRQNEFEQALVQLKAARGTDARRAATSVWRTLESVIYFTYDAQDDPDNTSASSASHVSPLNRMFGARGHEPGGRRSEKPKVR
jgi:hypothetical protein